MTRAVSDRLSSRDGASHVELIVSIVIFLIAVLGMIQMSVVARQQARAGKLATDMWAVAQLKLEEIKATDFDSVSGGADTIRGYPVSWTVSGVDPKAVTLSITRPSVLGGQVVDEVLILVPDWAN